MTDRLTYSRDGRHVGGDPFERRCRWTVGTLAVGFNAFVAVLGLPFISGAALVLVADVVILTVGYWLSDHVIRPHVFDREQREHEIVPFRYAEEHLS